MSNSIVHCLEEFEDTKNLKLTDLYGLPRDFKGLLRYPRAILIVLAKVVLGYFRSPI